jgi:[protein]-arginine 3-hydroxylase / protease
LSADRNTVFKCVDKRGHYRGYRNEMLRSQLLVAHCRYEFFPGTRIQADLPRQPAVGANVPGYLIVLQEAAMFDVKSTFEVPRVERLSRRGFQERFLLPQRPVIISGAMEDWPARKRWTNDYLVEKVGARTVRPSKAHAGIHLYDPKKQIIDTSSPMKLAEYIDLVAGGAISDGQLYAALFPIKTALPELWPDVRFPPLIDEDKYGAVNFWFGPGNNFTPLHYDPVNNFLTQIRGRKQVILCPPREIARLSPFPFNYIGNHVSQVNVASPDLTQFPAWARADRTLLELGPGDMLFIPVYWWHAVWGIDQNMSINYWWRPRAANLLQHPRQTARSLRSQAYLGCLAAAGIVQRVARRAGLQSSPDPKAPRDSATRVAEQPS